jgi:3-hydroxyacyl-CoA dehydrogenase
MGKINFSTELDSCVKTSDLVIEAIVENVDIKAKLFNGLDKVIYALHL